VDFLLAQGVDLEHQSDELPRVLQLARTLTKQHTAELGGELGELVHKLAALRGPKQVESDIETYVRDNTCSYLEGPPPEDWPNPRYRWNHLSNPSSNLKNFKTSGLKEVCKLLELGYGRQGLYAIINDQKEREDPIKQMQLVHLQVTLLKLLVQNQNPEIKKQLAASEKRVLAECIAYIFDPRAVLDRVEKECLDDCVIRWQYLGLVKDGIKELQKYGNKAIPWLKKLRGE
jgi:hypothetical protein